MNLEPAGQGSLLSMIDKIAPSEYGHVVSAGAGGSQTTYNARSQTTPYYIRGFRVIEGTADIDITMVNLNAAGGTETMHLENVAAGDGFEFRSFLVSQIQVSGSSVRVLTF